jgi:glycosyltransferase involved in cell wall biosynthesis
VEINFLTFNKTKAEDVIYDKNFQYEILPNKSNLLKKVLCFIKWGKKYKPDAIICVEPITMFAGLYLKKKLKCRVIYDCHEYFSELKAKKNRFIAPLYKITEEYLSKRMSSIITVNEILVAKYKKINKNVYLCPNLPKNEIINTQQNKKEYDLIYIGAINFHRGIRTYLKAVKLFKDNNINFKFLVVGLFKRETVKDFFYSYIKENKLEDYVVYKEYMSYNKVLTEIKNSKIGIFFGDLNIMPMYSITIPFKVFDYMSQAIPVIVNNLDMLKELVENANCGWVINENEEELYNLLNKILPDQELIIKTGLNGAEYVKTNLSWETCENDLYKAVLGE